MVVVLCLLVFSCGLIVLFAVLFVWLVVLAWIAGFVCCFWFSAVGGCVILCVVCFGVVSLLWVDCCGWVGCCWLVAGLLGWWLGCLAVLRGCVLIVLLLFIFGLCIVAFVMLVQMLG